MPKSMPRWRAISADVERISAYGPRFMTPPRLWPKDVPMNGALIARRLAGQAPASRSRVKLHRRDFLKLTALAGGGLTVAWVAPAVLAAEEAAPAAKQPADPSAFI